MDKFDIKDLLDFKKLITPSVLKYLYWLSCVGIVIGFLVSIFSAFSMSRYIGFGGILGSILAAIIVTIISFIVVRLSFELIVVSFKINSNLNKIAENTTPKSIDKESDLESKIEE